MGDFKKISGDAYNEPRTVEHEEHSIASAADAIRRMNEQGGKPDEQARAEREAPYPTTQGALTPDAPPEIHSPPEPHDSGAYLDPSPPVPPYPHKR